MIKDYQKIYYRKNIQKFRKGGKYYKYKTKYDNGDDSKGLIINRGKFVIDFS
tara:strand:- start:1556 stop:1711 length:156 start_codon:yes stop_codon:yes gene_type:complete